MDLKELLKLIREQEFLINQSDPSGTTSTALEGVRQRAREELARLRPQFNKVLQDKLIAVTINSENRNEVERLVSELNENGVLTVDAMGFYNEFDRSTKDLFGGQFPLDAVAVLQSYVNSLLSGFGLRLTQPLNHHMALGTDTTTKVKNLLESTLGSGGAEPYYALVSVINTMNVLVHEKKDSRIIKSLEGSNPVLVVIHNTTAEASVGYEGNQKFKRVYNYNLGDDVPKLADFVKMVREDLKKDGIVKDKKKEGDKQ